MQLRWLKIKNSDEMLDHPKAVLVEGLNGGMYVLQAGHWEEVGGYNDPSSGRWVPAMKMTWIDINIDQP